MSATPQGGAHLRHHHRRVAGAGAGGLADGIPPEPIRELRDLTRYRKTLIQQRASEVHRVQKFLETANIKLGSVATDVLGVSGRAMLEALIAGERDATQLAKLAKGTLRNKRLAWRAALLSTTLFCSDKFWRTSTSWISTSPSATSRSMSTCAACGDEGGLPNAQDGFHALLHRVGLDAV